MNPLNAHLSTLTKLLYKVLQLLTKDNFKSAVLVSKYTPLYLNHLHAEVGATMCLRGILYNNIELLSRVTFEQMRDYVGLVKDKTTSRRMRFLTTLCATETDPFVPNQETVHHISSFKTNRFFFSHISLRSSFERFRCSKSSFKISQRSSSNCV